MGGPLSAVKVFTQIWSSQVHSLNCEPSFSVFTAFCTRFCPHSASKHVSSRMTSSFTERQRRSIARASKAEHRFIAAVSPSRGLNDSLEKLGRFGSQVFIPPPFSMLKADGFGSTESTPQHPQHVTLEKAVSGESFDQPWRCIDIAFSNSSGFLIEPEQNSEFSQKAAGALVTNLNTSFWGIGHRWRMEHSLQRKRAYHFS